MGFVGRLHAAQENKNPRLNWAIVILVDLDPTDQRSVVENLRFEGGGDLSLADDGSQLLRDILPVSQVARLRLVAEMKNGLHFVSPGWITLCVPNPW